MDITSLTQEEKDIFYMREALSLAKEAEALDEVPVGAVLVARGKIVGRAKKRARNASPCHAARRDLRD